jgi:hypothetical protein
MEELLFMLTSLNNNSCRKYNVGQGSIELCFIWRTSSLKQINQTTKDLEI